jgi:hypothetical protein
VTFQNQLSSLDLTLSTIDFYKPSLCALFLLHAESGQHHFNTFNNIPNEPFQQQYLDTCLGFVEVRTAVVDIVSQYYLHQHTPTQCIAEIHIFQ